MGGEIKTGQLPAGFAAALGGEITGTNPALSAASVVYPQVGLLPHGVAHGVFDATAGKAVGVYDTVGVGIPDNALIIGCFVRVRANFTGGAGAALSLGIEALGDLRGATVVTDPVWQAGVKNTAANWGVAGVKETTAMRALRMEVTVNPLTGGIADVFAFFVVMAG